MTRTRLVFLGALVVLAFMMLHAAINWVGSMKANWDLERQLDAPKLSYKATGLNCHEYDELKRT